MQGRSGERLPLFLPWIENLAEVHANSRLLYQHLSFLLPCDQATCGFCRPTGSRPDVGNWHLTHVEPPCYDTLDICPYLASGLGICESHSWMNSQCSRSCALCTPVGGELELYWVLVKMQEGEPLLHSPFCLSHKPYSAGFIPPPLNIYSVAFAPPL